MSKMLNISEDRLQELFELTVAKTKAILNQEAPNAVISNSNVYITNNYGDSYEEDHSQPTEPVEKAPVKSEPKVFFVREEIITLMVGAEKLMQDLESRNKDGFAQNAAFAKAALKERFEDLQLKMKGDTSVESIQKAYLWMVVQLAIASKLSQVFVDG